MEYSHVSSKVILDQEIEAQQNSQKKENMIVIVIIGLIGGSLFLVFLVSLIAIDYQKYWDYMLSVVVDLRHCLQT